MIGNVERPSIHVQLKGCQLKGIGERHTRVYSMTYEMGHTEP